MIECNGNNTTAYLGRVSREETGSAQSGANQRPGPTFHKTLGSQLTLCYNGLGLAVKKNSQERTIGVLYRKPHSGIKPGENREKTGRKPGYFRDTFGIVLQEIGGKMLVYPITFDARISSTFEDHQNRKPPSTAPGVDLAVPTGTPVRAGHDGRVNGVRFTKRGGRQLWVHDLSGGWLYCCHLDCICALGGELVKAGQVIAYSGNTGKSTGSHLHWAYKKDGVWLDPMSHIGSAKGG